MQIWNQRSDVKLVELQVRWYKGVTKVRVGVLEKSFLEIWRRLTDVTEHLRIVLRGEDKMKDSQTALASIDGWNKNVMICS